MKVSAALCALVGLSAAAPANHMLEKRQTISNELLQGGCRSVIFIMARASTEPGNMGMSMGPMVCTGLKARFGAGNVACQGVGGPYTAGLMDNVLPDGTTPQAIAEAVRMYQRAAQCPNAKIVGAGYSQGTAVTANAITKLDSSTKNKVLGILLYGYTKNAQTRSSIPGFPSDRVKVFCRIDDGVCGGALLVTAGHFGYLADGTGPQGINFLVQKIQAAR